MPATITDKYIVMIIAQVPMTSLETCLIEAVLRLLINRICRLVLRETMILKLYSLDQNEYCGYYTEYTILYYTELCLIDAAASAEKFQSGFFDKS